MDQLLLDTDVNGFAERDLSGGEFLQPTGNNTVFFQDGCPSLATGQYLQAVVMTRAEASTMLAINYARLVAGGLPSVPASRIAFIRVMLAQKGLISPRWTTDELSTRYNESVQLNNVVVPADEYGAVAQIVALNSWGAADAVKIALKANLTDIICTLAFVFRTRAHHYKPDLEIVYTRILGRCGIAIADLSITCEQMFTLALHAIPPIVLDLFWDRCRLQGHCSGALNKRWTSAPAGSAALFAIRTGLRDLTMMFPAIIAKHEAIALALDAECDYLENHRWEGSINHNYYGVPRHAFDENLLSGIISLLLGSLNQFAPNSNLANSPSLIRVGQNAPLTQAVIGTIMRQIVRSEAFVTKYIESV